MKEPLLNKELLQIGMLVFRTRGAADMLNSK